MPRVKFGFVDERKYFHIWEISIFWLWESIIKKFQEIQRSFLGGKYGLIDCESSCLSKLGFLLVVIRIQRVWIFPLNETVLASPWHLLNTFYTNNTDNFLPVKERYLSYKKVSNKFFSTIWLQYNVIYCCLFLIAMELKRIAMANGLIGWEHSLSLLEAFIRFSWLSECECACHVWLFTITSAVNKNESMSAISMQCLNWFYYCYLYLG